MFPNLEFEEETASPEEIKVEASIISAMTYLTSLIDEAKTKITCGQYELYLKNFAFIRFVITKLGEMQDIYEKMKNQKLGDPIIRFSDVEDKINEILSHIKTYEVELAPKKVVTLDKQNPNPTSGINW